MPPLVSVPVHEQGRDSVLHFGNISLNKEDLAASSWNLLYQSWRWREFVHICGSYLPPSHSNSDLKESVVIRIKSAVLSGIFIYTVTQVVCLLGLVYK